MECLPSGTADAIDERYSIGRPLSADWLEHLNRAVVANLPSGCTYFPIIKPGISYISRRDMEDCPGNILEECDADAADKMVDEVLSDMDTDWARFARADVNLRVIRYRFQRSWDNVALRLNVDDRRETISREMLWRVENERIRVRERLGFSGISNRKPSNSPQYWLNLGQITIEGDGCFEDLKTSINPYLPPRPRFTGLGLLGSNIISKKSN